MNEPESCRVLLVAAGASIEVACARLAAGSAPGRYAVTAVASLALGIESLRQYRPDCVVLDLGRPDAAQAPEVRRLREYLPCAALLAVAPVADRAAAVAAIRDGADDCLEAETLDAARLGRAIDIAFERSAGRSRLMTLALRDLVTGLANRTQFHDALERAVARANRSGQVLALLYLDLDHFNAINNTSGYAAGDALLKAVAARLAGQVRAGDLLARVGGDEFALILENVSSREAAAAVGRKLLKSLATPVAIGSEPLSIAASIGIAFHPVDGDTADDLIRSANQAMHAAKHRGGNRLGSFSGLLDATIGPEAGRLRPEVAAQSRPVLYPAAAVA